MVVKQRVAIVVCITFFVLHASVHCMENPLSKSYETLDIPPDANTTEIRKAYRRLTLKHHPDKNPNNPIESTEKFKEIQAAYEMLNDLAERKKCDSNLQATEMNKTEWDLDYRFFRSWIFRFSDFLKCNSSDAE